METTLKRTKFVPSEAMKLPDVFVEAKDKLCYNPQAIRDQVTSVERRARELQVAAALDSLGIEPLDRASVEAYQSAKVSEVTARGASRFVKYMHGKKGEGLVTLLGVVGFASTIVTLGITAMSIDDKTHTLPHALAFKIVWSILASVLVSWIVLMIARHKRAATFTAMWKQDWISQYRLPVPDFALARALAVKEVLPAANFLVETLEEQGRNVPVEHTPRPPDPFLVLWLGDVKVYLDVWDEPKFEGRRMV